MKTAAPVVLRVEGFSIEFEQTDLPVVRAVEEVNLTLSEGEVLGIVGESGCGKTTLALGLLRLLPANGRIVRGRVIYQGKDLLDLREDEMGEIRWRHISIVFQGAMNALNPVRTIGDQIIEAIRCHRLPVSPEETDPLVCRLLDRVGINPARRNEYPHQYSGGMRQRAVIAMALACSPTLLIADEPTTALDVMIQAQILQLLRRLKTELGLSMILVTHDLGVVAEMCDHVLVMYGGVVAEVGTVDDIFNHPTHPYTRALLKAFPDITRPAERMEAIPGTPPRLDPPPPGCRFADRCPEVMARCREQAPKAHTIRPGHQVRCHLGETG